jgi:hypothetical protein
MTRDELIGLARTCSERQQRLSILGMVNIANQTPEQRIDLDAAYRVARDEWLMAEQAYQTGLQGYSIEGAADRSGK